ncbi:MAG: hypothetical protein ACE5DS_01600 [Kiloniellaceae bacterium]
MRDRQTRGVILITLTAGFLIAFAMSTGVLAGSKSPGGDYGSYAYDRYLENEAKRARAATAATSIRLEPGQEARVGASDALRGDAPPDGLDPVESEDMGYNRGR